MDRKLMIMEVSRKQDYIFASRKLRDNVSRSLNIRAVTENSFLQEAAGVYYNETENLVYSGGGHTVLQFADTRTATEFAKAVSTAVLRKYPDMEFYLKQIDYDDNLSPKENLTRLTSELERKKALRRASFRWLSLGVEKLNSETWKPELFSMTDELAAGLEEQIAPPEGLFYPLQFEELLQGENSRHENFISVVHIDGNAMGKRVEQLLDPDKVLDWDSACRLLRSFSDGTDEDFKDSFRETVDRLLRCRPELCQGKYIPIRPVILAGDDVCFVTSGKFGLECARMFLESLANKTNPGDGKGYAACAGVALVHYKYPFHMAYQLAEELCSSAKRYGQGLDADSRISAIDWHIEFGQLKNGLNEIREDYVTEDGNRLELRPLSVVWPKEISNVNANPVRTYAYFRQLCATLRGEYGKIARGKLKDLRTALKQGEIETRFFLADKQISDLLYHPFNAKYQTAEEYQDALRRILEGNLEKKDAFTEPDEYGVKRSLFFDALEMIDQFEPVEEVEEQ